jgi:hypothetical protein
VTTFTSPLFVKPVGIREVGGQLYVADNGAHKILRVDPITGFTAEVLAVSNVFWLSGRSDGKLVVATLAQVVFVYDPESGEVGPDLLTPVGGTTWITAEVDKWGTCGEVNAIYIVAMGGGGNTSNWRYAGGVLTSNPFGPSSANGTVGNTKKCQDIVGHYVWVFVPHPDEAIWRVQGLADVFASLIAVKPATWPVEDAFDNNTFNRGLAILKYGVVSGEPFDSKPSLTCMMAQTCWSLIGCSADHIANMPFTQQMAFVQGGMLGSFPRPNIKGRDLYGVLYIINRSSLRFCKEGKALMDGLLAFCSPMFGQELPPIAQRLPSPDFDIQMDVETVGGNWVVKFRDKYNNAKTPEAGLVVRLWVDEWLPEEQDLGTLASPWTIAAPTLTPGQHSRRCLPVVGSVPDPGKYRGRATVCSM